MSSLKQIEANRRNAFKSTGPITPEGKERSRRNGIRHGLTAETIIASVENAKDYQAFEAAVIADYNAESAVERELVLRLASVLWRLRRATGIEAALFESVTAQPGKSKRGHAHLSFLGGSTLREHNQSLLEATRHSEEDIGNRFIRLAALPTFPLDRLSRYEHILWRQGRQLVFTLESLRRRKREPKRSTFPFSLRSAYFGEFK